MPYQPQWNIENIKAGFERFYKENNRFPTSPEIDKAFYLPSSRQIQRLFGGLPNLRKLLGHTDIHFGKGEHRSKIGLSANINGKLGEKQVKDILIKRFHEPFVHIEKPVGESSKNRLDFYVYSPDGNFGVDVFTTSTIHDLASNLNIKLRKYSDFKEKLYLVVISESINLLDLNLYLSRKKLPLLENMELLLSSDFLEKIRLIGCYENPTRIGK